MIYLDYNGATCGFKDILSEAFEISNKFCFLNPSSIHNAGIKAKKIIDEAKKKILLSANAKCHDIYFTSGATEGNNTILNALNYDIIFTAKTEHESILAPLKNKPHKFIEIDNNGIVNLNHLEEEIKKLGSSNFLCSFMLVNNESGVIQNIKIISEITRRYGGLMHSDCSQGIGKIPFDIAELGVSMVTFSGSKMHSGLGGGVIICDSGFNFNPLILGGGQQNYKRGGTENVLQIFTLSKAFERVNSSQYLTNYKEKTWLFKEKIEDMVLNFGGDVFGKDTPRVTNTSLIRMQNVNNFIQLMEFDLNEICISIGSACSSGKTDISHVLKACDITDDEARQYIRFSSGVFNQNSDIDKFCEIWKALSKR